MSMVDMSANQFILYNAGSVPMEARRFLSTSEEKLELEMRISSPYRQTWPWLPQLPVKARQFAGYYLINTHLSSLYDIFRSNRVLGEMVALGYRYNEQGIINTGKVLTEEFLTFAVFARSNTSLRWGEEPGDNWRNAIKDMRTYLASHDIHISLEIIDSSLAFEENPLETHGLPNESLPDTNLPSPPPEEIRVRSEKLSTPLLEEDSPIVTKRKREESEEMSPCKWKRARLDRRTVHDWKSVAVEGPRALRVDASGYEADDEKHVP
ncbi:hypothetical protein BDV96DRAFT_31957 [Lophiotrema nucula]|uniref:Uncharacterized protein n=1 Tax=Lophiotrema nucula TaxID=690887 RepID=A0A6A5ZC79_9PLEO|nr:hypothetical protein BDV96DRAFT_31957 [Lophiotrema nucula]